MGFAENYFHKQKSFKPSISCDPQADLAFIIVIPATREKDVISSLKSLFDCAPIQNSFEIIVLINAASNAPQETKKLNKLTFEEVEKYARKRNEARRQVFPILNEDMPVKDAGVGLARKSGMDEALWRFNLINKPGGFIICFDADAICDANYLATIENHCKNYPSTKGCSVYFEHDIDNKFYPEYQRNAIISYEIHLRYYKLALSYAGFPYSFHTVGSSMLVNALCYAQQGGMNKHKAGEDFYFLQKIIPLGEYYELNKTRILLSPRESDRVPFGTGAAMVKMMDSGVYNFETYNFQSFLDLKELFPLAGDIFRKETEDVKDLIRSLPEPLREFLMQHDFEMVVEELNQNSAGMDTFLKRFFQWWNAFRILKYLNYAHDGYYKKTDATIAAEELLNCIIPDYSNSGNSRLVLELLRKFERDQTA